MRTTLLVGLTLVLVLVTPGAVTAAGGQSAAAPAATAVMDADAGDADAGDADAGDADAGEADVVEAHHADGLRVPAATTDSTQEDACEAVAGGEQRENPENDTLGWENGCWYDDPVDVTVEDGLNDTELPAVVARTMARIEQLRELEFRSDVPVEVISRETYRQRTAEAFANATTAERLHQNVKYEALFMIDEDTDALAQIQENRAGSVLGYYSPTQNRIVVISDDPETLELGEQTLAHELVHAVQDQHFNITDFDRSTTERDKAILGLVEGDAHYTEKLYEDRCAAGWDCPSIESTPPSIPGGFHWGLYFINFQPYSDGPLFVETVRDDGGWAAVDELYDDPPESSEQVIDPEKYPDEEPVEVTVEDRSDDRWRILDLEEGVNHAEFGQVGLSVMFVYPTYEGSPEFVSSQEFRNSGPDSNLDPLDYGNNYTAGWAGDRLYPYVTDESVETNETGYVWKTVWDSEADAEEFAEGYEEMLAFRGAEPVDERADTYRIPEDERFDDAYYVNRTGDTVVIVNAPSVEELQAVRAGAAPEATPSPTPSATPTPDDDDDDGTDDASESTSDGTVGSPSPTTTTAPGFGVIAVAITALVVPLASRWFRG